MSDTMKQKGLPEDLKPHFCFLYAVNDMKKANNGYGPTSFIDDTLVTLYFLIYLYYCKDMSTPTIVDSPSAKKKIAKRDIFPLTNDVLKLFKSELDTLVKLEIFNEYVANGKKKVETERKLKLEKQEQAEQKEPETSVSNAPEIIVIDDDCSSQEQDQRAKRELETSGEKVETKKVKTDAIIYEVID